MVAWRNTYSRGGQSASRNSGSEKKWDADLILLSMGFLQPEHYINDQLGLELDELWKFHGK